MTGKPKSNRHAVLAAMYCNHPELDAGHAAVLTCLAANGDGATGKNCRPGNINLMAATKLSKRMMQYKLSEMCSWKLISLTERGDGRKKASVYAICFDNTHFPNRALGGNQEWLIEEPEENRATAVAQFTENRATDIAKPRNENAETVQHFPAKVPKPCNSYCTTPKPTPKPHQQPTAKNGEALVGVVCEKTNTNTNTIEKAKDFHKKCNTTWQQIYGPTCLCRFSLRSADDLVNLTEMVDPDTLLDAFKLYTQDRFANGDEPDPWAVSKFISRAPEFLLKIKPANVNTARIDKQTQLTNGALAELGKAYGVDKPAAPEVPEDFDPLEGVE